MATVLKEIAPLCEIYAINGILYEDGKTIEEQDEIRSEYLVKAIDWAIENGINVLTYSHARFHEKFTDRVDNAINKAVENGITTTFIHCDSHKNLFPYACFTYYNSQKFRREPDVKIYHFDYNVLFTEKYESLIPQDFKDILIGTSCEITDAGSNWFDLNPCPRVVDIGRAVHWGNMSENKRI